MRTHLPSEVGDQQYAPKRKASILGALFIVSGCATLTPPEIHLYDRDHDQLVCARGANEEALPACERIINRPDPFKWPGGPHSVHRVYAARADSALHLARILSDVGREEECLNAIRRALTFVQKYDDARVKKTTWPPGTRAYEGELTEIDKTQTWVVKKKAFAHLAAGLSLAQLARWREAVDDLREAVRLEPSNWVAWGTLGVAANQTEQFDESANAFRRAVELRPNYFVPPLHKQVDVWQASKERRRYQLQEAILPKIQ